MRRLLPWLACACSEPALYPQPVFLDTAVGSTPTGATADTGEPIPTEPDLPCSTNGGVAVVLTTRNDASVAGTMFWRDATCFEVPYQTVAPGASVDQYTFAGHVWVFRDAAGTYLDHLVLDDAPTSTWVIP